MDHDRNIVRCNQKTDIDHVFWRAKWCQDILLGKNRKQKDFSSLSSWIMQQWQ